MSSMSYRARRLEQARANDRLRNITVPERTSVEHYIDDHGDRVEVMRVNADQVTAVALWCSGRPVVEHDALDYEKTFPGINLMTKNGPQRASDGDYVIKHPDGWFEVQKPSEFHFSHWEA